MYVGVRVYVCACVSVSAVIGVSVCGGGDDRREASSSQALRQCTQRDSKDSEGSSGRGPAQADAWQLTGAIAWCRFIGFFRVPLVRDPLIISLYILI